MRKRACIGYIFFSLFVGLAAISASAQSRSRLAADVPFDFEVGSTMLSAGEYTIQQLSSSDTGLLILRADAKQRASVLTYAALANRHGRARLVFNKYGDRYFLASLWDGGHEGRAIPKSGSERNIRKEMATLKNFEPEVVAIALVSQ